MNKLSKKEKKLWFIGITLSFLLFIVGLFLNIKDLKTYAGITEATCIVRTRCTYQVNGIDYIYQANYYTDVNPKEPMQRKIRYNLENPNKSHLTGITLGIFLMEFGIFGIIVGIIYLFFNSYILYSIGGFLPILISTLLYAPMSGTINPIFYYKTFKLYGGITMIPLIFFIGGIFILSIPIINRLQIKKANSSTNQISNSKVTPKQAIEDTQKREKDKKIDKILNLIFDNIFIIANFIEAGIAGYAFIYILSNLLKNEQNILSPLNIALIGIFIVPLFFIFFIKMIDIIAFCFTKNDIQEKLDLLNKIKKVATFILTNETLCAILFLIITSIKESELPLIIFATITFILPLSAMIIYNIYKFILDIKNINKDTLKFDFDKLMKILSVVFASLFLLFGIVTTIIGAINAVKEDNYAILFFYAFWGITLTTILLFTLKQSKK